MLGRQRRSDSQGRSRLVAVEGECFLASPHSSSPLNSLLLERASLPLLKILFKFLFVIVTVCVMYMSDCVHMRAKVHMGRSKDSFQESVPPRSAPDSGAQTQVGGFVQQVLLADEPSCWTPLGWFISDACLLMSTQDFLQ